MLSRHDGRQDPDRSPLRSKAAAANAPSDAPRRTNSRKLLIAAAVLCGQCAAAMLALGFTRAFDHVGLWVLPDAGLLLVLALGLLLLKSRVCAVLLSGYALYSAFYLFAGNGTLLSLPVLAAAALALAGAFGLARERTAASAEPAAGRRGA